jgi:protein O-GlcNAc transferase
MADCRTAYNGLTGWASPAAMRIFHIQALTAVLLACLALLTFGAGEVVAQNASASKPASAHTPEAHLGKGYEALKQDQYDLAASEFRAALELDSTLVLRARFPLAVALFEQHRSAEARQEFEAVRREVGDHPNILYYLGRLDLEDRKYEDATVNLNKAAAQPPFPDTAYYLGYAYLQKGDLTAAEKWLKQAAQASPRDARIPYQLGFVYRKQGRDEEAGKAMALSKELRERANNESQLRLECGQKLDQGPREDARAICEQLYDPTSVDKLTELGTIYGQHGDLEDALKPLGRASELAPQSPQTQYNLALVYYQLNRFAEARAPLAKAIERWPDLFPLNFLYGAVLLKLGEDLLAHQALEHAHQLNPQDTGTTDLLYTAALELGAKSQKTGQYDDALRSFQEAAKLLPQEPGPHRHMAEVYQLTGQAAQARAEQQQVDLLSKSPSPVD